MSSPAIMIEMCNKICPFRPDIPACAECTKVMQILSQGGATTPVTEPEAVSIDPHTHSIIFKPEIISMGKVQKQCCYLDQCEVVPYDFRCDTRCYEPCDQICTGRCFVNPQCPNKCIEIRIQLFKIKYQIWLANKLNEIKLKYRAMAEACMLKTKMAYEAEMESMKGVSSQVMIGNVQVIPQVVLAEIESIPNNVITDTANNIIEQHNLMPMVQISQPVVQVPQPIVQQAVPMSAVHVQAYPGQYITLQDSNDYNDQQSNNQQNLG